MTVTDPPSGTPDAPEPGEGAPTTTGVAPGRTTRRNQRSRSSRRTAIEWGVLIVAALVIAMVIRTFVFQAFYIPSASMVPTLAVGDRVLVNKLSYRLHDPNRGDIVVFKAPPTAATAEIKDLVKRVVGLPGETIEGRDGRIYIDDRPLDEPYLPEDVASNTFGPVRVPEDSYYLLGDNRPYSKDSTYFGPIARKQLIGRAFVRFWPLSHLGFL